MKVKICGVTNPDDACFAVEAGADFVGIIFSKISKRVVSLAQAKEIRSAIKTAEVVGVFVDESAEEILRICHETNINTIQLHGAKSREQLRYLQDFHSIFYAVPYVEDKFEYPALTSQVILLFDHHQAGSGQTFNWEGFTPPQRPWVLAGGLNKDNVATAIQLLKPSMVDVASGVEYSDSIRKDHALVKAFIDTAKQEKIL